MVRVNHIHTPIDFIEGGQAVRGTAGEPPALRKEVCVNASLTLSPAPGLFTFTRQLIILKADRLSAILPASRRRYVKRFVQRALCKEVCVTRFV